MVTVTAKYKTSLGEQRKENPLIRRIKNNRHVNRA
jgi:hypothetical protein